MRAGTAACPQTPMYSFRVAVELMLVYGHGSDGRVDVWRGLRWKGRWVGGGFDEQTDDWRWLRWKGGWVGAASVKGGMVLQEAHLGCIITNIQGFAYLNLNGASF